LIAKQYSSPAPPVLDQILLAASIAGVHRIPRSVSSTQPVEMTQHRGTVGTAGPVLASVVRGICERPPVRLRTGENVVLVRVVADALLHLALFADSRDLVDPVAEPRLLERVPVRLRDKYSKLRSVG
jgi:hypothetical protein